jgi:pyruvate kinase
MQRRTRIVATLGPATDPPGVLDALLAAGVDVARINFSHGSPAEHLARIERLRQAAGKRPVAILADLPGPKLRALLKQSLPLAPGQEVTLAGEGTEADIQVTEPEVIADVRPGQRILLDDGRLQFRAIRVDGKRLRVRVETGGTLQPNKGINLPDTPLSIPAITERDRQALAVAVRAGADWVALSFVRHPSAGDQLRQAFDGLGARLPILAKMERPEAVEHAGPIVDAFDGIMVARGDLGVEIPLEQVPHVQKRLIHLARSAGKPVVTATDMLDSMRTNPRPTRAEASDVANAILDGTDAVMLSGETAIGQYPVEAVACMARIVREAEGHFRREGEPGVSVPRAQIDDHISHATCWLARSIGAQAIVAPTYSGRTPRLIARHRPQARIVAVAPDEAVVRQLALVWGLVPVPMTEAGEYSKEDRLEAAVRAAFVHGALQIGDLAVVVAGHPVEGAGHFPTIRVVRIE